MRKIALLLFLLIFSTAPLSRAQSLGTINTIAGGVPNNLPATSVGLALPTAVVKDSSGNVYVAVEAGSITAGGVYKIDPNGTLTTFVGDGTILFSNSANNGDGGPANLATLGFVTGLALDAQQNLYISDLSYGTIRKIDASTGIITTVAGGGTGCGNGNALGDGCAATSAILASPYQVYVDASHNIFIADSGHNAIREVVAATGQILTIAGGGTGCAQQTNTVGDGCLATSAILNGPVGVYRDSHGNVIISDTTNFRLREVSSSTGIIQTIAGTGTGGFNGDGALASVTQISNPYGLFLDSSDNIFFSDLGNARVREIVAATGLVQTIVGGASTGCNTSTDTIGDGCPAANAFLLPYSIFVDPSNNLYVADVGNLRVREVVAAGGVLTSLDTIQLIAGNGTAFFSGDGGPALNAQLSLPYGVAVNAAGDLFISDTSNERIRKVSATTGIIQTYAGGETDGCPQETDAFGDGCPATQATLSEANLIFLDSAGNLFISDFGNSLIRKVDAVSGIISTVAGGGAGCAAQTDALGDGCPATQAILSNTWGVYVDAAGNIFIADYSNNRIRKVVAGTGLIQTVAGTGVAGFNGDNIPATQAQLNLPISVYGDSSGNIYFSDSSNFRIREIQASTGNILTVAGTGTPGYNGDNIPATSAQIVAPAGVYVDLAGNIFFDDFANFRIREVVASSGLIQTVAGTGAVGFSGDGGPATSAKISYVPGIAGDAQGNLYLADAYSVRVRKMFGVVPANVLAIATPSLPSGTVGVPYSFSLQATGGVTPYAWSKTAGSLPTGFNPFSAGGLLSGTPTAAGIFNFTLSVSDSSTPQENASKSFSITINQAAPTLVSIAVTPANSSIFAGGQQQFTATGTFSDGSHLTLNNAVWGSSTPAVASISSSGLASGLLVGATSITAAVGNIFGSTSLTVTAPPPTLTSISVFPSVSTLSVGGFQQFIAIGHFSDGSTQNLTTTALWSSSTASVASISNVSPSQGLATGLSLGTTTVTATSGNVFGSALLTINSGGAVAYIGSSASTTCCLNALNLATNQVLKAIPVTTKNEPIGITPDQSRIYVADNGNSLIDVVDTTTNTLVTTIPSGPGATSAAITPDGQFGYVSDLNDNNVSVFSVATNSPVTTIPIGFPSEWTTVTPDGAFVYAASAIDNRVAVIRTSTNTLASTFTLPPVSGQPIAGALGGPTFNPAGTIGYFVQLIDTVTPGSVSVVSIPGNTVLATIPVGNFPYQSAITPNGAALYVVNAASNSVTVINTATNTVVATIPVGGAPQSIAASPDGSLMYVANAKTNTLSIIQTATNTVTSTIAMTSPFGIVIASPPPAPPSTPLLLNPPNISFGSAVVGTPPVTRTIAVTNPGATPVTFSGFSLNGPNAANYSFVNGCTAPLAPGVSCNLQISFAATAAGVDTSALLTITSNNGVAASVQSVPFEGLGTGATVATFSGLSPSQAIAAGTAAVTLTGVIGNGAAFPPAGELIQINVGPYSAFAAIGANGTFTKNFTSSFIPGSTTPYPITYHFPGDATFTVANNSTTTLTINATGPSFVLAVSDIGTGNGVVSDNLGLLNCETASGVQSGACSVSYAAGTQVTLTAAPSAPTTFGGWSGPCSGTGTCVVTMTAPLAVSASFVPPPQQITLTFNPGTNVPNMATYNCPSNPSPSPQNPCTDTNAHALALAIPQVITPFTVTVQASELPPSVANGICSNGASAATDPDCRFATFFTSQTQPNGDKLVPLCYPYANGNCVHYQVFSGTPGVEPDPSAYIGPIDWNISWNNDAFVPSAPFAGNTPRLYDDPDYAVSSTSPFGTDCTTAMLVGNPPVATNPPIFCQFEFDITTGFNPTKKVDAAISGRTKQFNDVIVAFPPNTPGVGTLSVSEAPLAATVTSGNPIGFTFNISDSATGPVTGAMLTDVLPAGTNVNWSITPAYSGPGNCSISGAIGSQVLNCAFGTINTSQTFTIGLLSPNSSAGTYTDTATLVVGTQQTLSVGTISVLGASVFSSLTPSQSITVGTASITLSGTISSGTIFPAVGETVSIKLNGVTQTAPIGSSGSFTTSFSTASLLASPTPYVITYTYAGDSNLSPVSDSTTSVTVNPLATLFSLSVTDIGTGNGSVTDNLGLINCVTAAGVQSGTCSANYAGGTQVTLTAAPSAPTTFGGWSGTCSGTGTCVVTMTAPMAVSASFAPPPQQITLTFNPGTNVPNMATYNCPSNPSPSPQNPCTDTNAHALALAIPQVITPFTVTVQASELPPSVANGICSNGASAATDPDCRFATFFTSQTQPNGDKLVPLCYPYANGNCVHYQVFSGTPGVEPDPSAYIGPIDWNISWNNDAFVPPAPFAGNTPRLYDDPDYAVSSTSPFGTDCTTPMLVGNPPAATNPPIFCQFEFDITTGFNPTKKVDAAISGRTKQFNDVIVAFPPSTPGVGTLTISETPAAPSVTSGNPIGFTFTIADSAVGPVTGATLTDVLPAGTNVNWSISPAYSGPGTCSISGAVGSQILNCAFGTINAGQTFTIGLLSPNSSAGTYTDTATLVVGTQQTLSIGTVAVKGTSAFSSLTPSQSITAGTPSITLSGTISSGTNFPAVGETVSIKINGLTQATAIGSSGSFTTSFSTSTLPASATPYVITYTYAGDLSLSSASNSGTSLTVNSGSSGGSSALVASPTSLDFGQVPIGEHAFKSFTLKNTGSSAVGISSISRGRTGTGNYTDYSVFSSCTKFLAPGKTCTVNVSYSANYGYGYDYVYKSFPAASSTSVIITYSGAGSPLSVPVQAQNINPRPDFSDNSIFFGNQNVRTASKINKVTLVNRGTTPLIISAINISGDFALDRSSTCTANTSLAPKQSCTFAVIFKPQKQGWRFGQLNIIDNALLRTPSVDLSGIGR